MDELSKSLASGMSRRQALWRFIVGAAAGVAATVAPRRAVAATRISPDCAACCAPFRGIQRALCMLLCRYDPNFSCNIVF